MLKNNRPYTDENGHIDAALLTDCTPDEIRKIGEWIRKYVRHSDEEHFYSSYGLKHVLEIDTRIYLTNNQFKDALLLAGFDPINPNELNWRYNLHLTHKDFHNDSPFFKAAMKYVDVEAPMGDFARTMMDDEEFPVFDDHDIILEYLENLGAWSKAIDAFEELWKEIHND